jgi:hypothetical protein
MKYNGMVWRLIMPASYEHVVRIIDDRSVFTEL